jgi:hypothetical protein
MACRTRVEGRRKEKTSGVGRNNNTKKESLWILDAHYDTHFYSPLRSHCLVPFRSISSLPLSVISSPWPPQYSSFGKLYHIATKGFEVCPIPSRDHAVQVVGQVQALPCIHFYIRIRTRIEAVVEAGVGRYTRLSAVDYKFFSSLQRVQDE